MEEEVARLDSGRLLLQGAFGVHHKAGQHRLVFDKRPADCGELRLNWARLPLGAHFTRVVLAPHQ
eukprot:8561547-Karenia_brevis.AAC.1